MDELKEIEFFKNLLNEPENDLVKKAIINDGRIPIGYNCYQVPEPLLSMGKVFPLRLRAPGVSSTEKADSYMSAFICSYARSILEFALEGKYNFFRGLVFAASCTHSIRCGDNIKILDAINSGRDGFFVHTLDTPRKVYDSGITMFIRDIKRLSTMIAQKFSVDTSGDALRKAIKTMNEYNRILKEISDLRKAENPKISGTEFHTLLVASQTAPKDMLIEPLKKLKAALDDRDGITEHRARIMVVGSIFDNPLFTALIEKLGGLVVADRYCFGSLPGMEEIMEEGDPYENIARHYLETCQCPRMMEKIKSRVRDVKKWFGEFTADGIIFENMKFCDLWGYEGVSMINTLREDGLPIVRIEREYPFTGEGQLRTRVQAFIELIENRRLTKALAKQREEVC